MDTTLARGCTLRFLDLEMNQPAVVGGLIRQPNQEDAESVTHLPMVCRAPASPNM